jgi:hypothetical protein
MTAIIQVFWAVMGAISAAAMVAGFLAALWDWLFRRDEEIVWGNRVKSGK